MIIDHGDGYHSVLAGLAGVNGRMGQWVLSGEPVGRMSTDTAGRTTLYYELRRNGEPLNPLPWLASLNDKVRG